MSLQTPLFWHILSNKYAGHGITLARHRDRRGKTSVALGLAEARKKGEKKKEPLGERNKVLIIPPGGGEPIRYRGRSLDPLVDKT